MAPWAPSVQRHPAAPGRRSQCAVVTWPLARRSPPHPPGDLSAAAVMLICLALPRRLFVKLARPFKLAGKLHSIPMNDDTPELKGWRRNQNGTYTPISSETIEDVKARSPERRIALGVLRQLRATDSIEGMSTEYLSMLTPEDDPRVTVELVQKARQAKSGGFSNSSIDPRGGRHEMRMSSKGKYTVTITNRSC